MDDYLHHESNREHSKFLTFYLNDQPYGVNVTNILQIIAIPEITPIPQTPVFIKGVINRSGRITPVMDLRLRLNLPVRDYDDRTSIIVIKAHIKDGSVTMGIIVDNVVEVMDIGGENVDELPPMGSEIDNNYIAGMAKIKGKVITLLDTERILSREMLNKLKDIQQKSTS